MVVMYKSNGLKKESEVLDAVAKRLIKSGPSPPMRSELPERIRKLFSLSLSTVYPKLQGGRQ
jgi:hypothetical protein